VQGNAAPDPAPAFQFRYLAADDAYEILIPTLPWSRLALRTTVDQQTIHTLSGIPDGTASLFIPGVRNNRLALFHTSFGEWNASRIDPTNPDRVDQNYGLFCYGIPTAAGDVPTSGTATYDSYASAFFGYFDGEARLVFDFGAGTVTGSFEGLLNDGIGGLGSIGRYELVNIAYAPGGTTFTGRFRAAGGAVQGSFEGRFTGPQASELMVRWQGEFDDPYGFGTRPLAGIWVGRRS
jgi:hypothetical protein